MELFTKCILKRLVLFEKQKNSFFNFYQKCVFTYEGSSSFIDNRYVGNLCCSWVT